MSNTTTAPVLSADAEQAAVAPMRYLAQAMIYGETVAEMLAAAVEAEREGEFGISADIRTAAVWRCGLFEAYGV